MTDWVQKQLDRIRQEQAEEDQKGGPGSGHFGHEGRPGHRGGSQPGSGGGGASGEEQEAGGGQDVVSYDTHLDLYKPDYEVADGYYRPDRPIKVYIQDAESHPTNAWYGSSQIYQYGHTEYTATPDDVLIKWPGGNFIHRGGEGPRETIAFAVSDKSPFERTYGLGRGRYVPAGAMTYLGRDRPLGKIIPVRTIRKPKKRKT